MNTFENLVRICEEQMGIDPSLLTKQTTFDEIEADSLDVVEILMAIEEEYDIVIPESVGEKAKDLGELSDFIDTLIG